MNTCPDCEKSALPGAIVRTYEGQRDGMGFGITQSADVEACETCNLYPDPHAAAVAFARSVGGAWVVSDWDAAGEIVGGQCVGVYESFDAAVVDLRDRIAQVDRSPSEDPVATEGRVEYVEPPAPEAVADVYDAEPVEPDTERVWIVTETCTHEVTARCAEDAEEIVGNGGGTFLACTERDAEPAGDA